MFFKCIYFDSEGSEIQPKTSFLLVPQVSATSRARPGKSQECGLSLVTHLHGCHGTKHLDWLPPRVHISKDLASPAGWSRALSSDTLTWLAGIQSSFLTTALSTCWRFLGYVKIILTLQKPYYKLKSPPSQSCPRHKYLLVCPFFLDLFPIYVPAENVCYCYMVWVLFIGEADWLSPVPFPVSHMDGRNPLLEPSPQPLRVYISRELESGAETKNPSPLTSVLTLRQTSTLLCVS